MPLLIEAGVSGLCIQVWACAAGGAWGVWGASSRTRYLLTTRLGHTQAQRWEWQPQQPWGHVAAFR